MTRIETLRQRIADLAACQRERRVSNRHRELLRERELAARDELRRLEEREVTKQ